MISLITTRKRKNMPTPSPAPQDKGKVRIIERSTSRCSKASVTIPRTQPKAPTARAFANLRRESLKLLSIFRSGKSSPPSSEPTPTGSNGTCTTDHTQRAEAHGLNADKEHLVLELPCFADSPASRLISLQTTESSVLHLDGESEPLMSIHTPISARLHTSRSTPGLSRQLTAKFSNAFLHNNNNTVIHRPKLSSRPTVLTENPGGPASTGQDVLPPQVTVSDVVSLPSQPSSFLGSSNALFSLQSTAPTSLVSSGAPISGETTHRGQNGFHRVSTEGSPPYKPTAEQLASHWLVFPRQDAPRLSKPSVATVENAAAAKIFFESHFNQLLKMKVSPRSLRRRDLERMLFSMAIPNTQRHKKREEWHLAESQHLRQTRVMKSKTLVRQRTKGVHISNYEIVRVLGKGSFGVVRLVREKSDHADVAERAEKVDGADDARPEGISMGTKRKQVYAMKVIRKSDMLRNSQEGHLRAERDFLVASENSRWVVPLVAAFQDNNNLYLVMEYMVGGDFLGLLLREDILDENVARWYVAEMVLCIEEAHKMSWIHRDIKPDNFLITASGHLKISDFGLAFDGHWTHNQTYYNERRYGLLRDLHLHVQGDAQDQEEEKEKQDSWRAFNLIHGKLSIRERHELKQDAASGPILDWLNHSQRRHFAKSIVGTSQYMAPEVIKGESYDGRCDWWSVGIILYECLYGCTPFFCENRQATKARILDHKRWLRFPPDQRYARPNIDRVPLMPVSRNAINLIMSLLEERQDRLSTKRYRENDWVIRDRALGAKRVRTLNCTGHMVFPNDAEDIKSHPFFRNIQWSTLHLTRPPFIPRVHGDQPITKYFDDEAEIMTASDHLDSSSYEAGNAETAVAPGEQSSPVTPALEQANELHEGQSHEHKLKAGQRIRHRGNQKKRPRDKLLRDPQVGRTVLEIRKKGAFVGYTYRRPRFSLLELEERVAPRNQLPRPYMNPVTM